MLAYFKDYRRLRGGKWYKVMHIKYFNICTWTKTKPYNIHKIILLKEKYAFIRKNSEETKRVTRS